MTYVYIYAIIAIETFIYGFVCTPRQKLSSSIIAGVVWPIFWSCMFSIGLLIWALPNVRKGINEAIKEIEQEIKD